MGTPHAALAAEMAEWEQAGLRRELKEAPEGRVDFTSNDYLSLARDPRVVEEAREALARHGAGGRASRLLGGGGSLHTSAEEAAAAWTGAEAALLFPSGYQANLGLIGSLVGRGDLILSDRLNHASLIDAGRLSRARLQVFDHADPTALENGLRWGRSARRRLVVTEGVFSMDGDLAPLAAYAELCQRHDAWLVVDEAHSAGLFGPEGAGAWAAIRDQLGEAARETLVARLVTGGKALGVGGAFIVGSRPLREHLINRARSFVFTTAVSPAVAGGLLAAVECAREADDARARTLGNARELARRLGRPEPDAAIVPWIAGAPEAAVEQAEALGEQGFDVRAVRPPTVPEGSSRLRLVTHAHNTEAEIEELARRLGPAPDDGSVELREPAHMLTVVGTDTDIGKTVVSALLLRSAKRAGPAAYWKPVQTGTDSDTEEVGRLAEARQHELLRPAWSLELPASPHEAARHEGKAIVMERLVEGFDGLRRTLGGTRVVVELAGGVLVPYSMKEGREGEDATQADWLQRVRTPVVLVARSGLGTLNHTLLTLEALRSRGIDPLALFLVGPHHPSNRQTLQEMGQMGRIFEVPRFEELLPAELDRWLDENPIDEVWQP